MIIHYIICVQDKAMFVFTLPFSLSLFPDKMKPQIVAKLANQCSDLYADAMKLLQLDTIRGLWPKVTDSLLIG